MLRSAEVTVLAPSFCTPRRDMHRCSASKHDPDALGLELALEPAGYLRRQPFLDLEVAAEVLDNAAELAQAEEPHRRGHTPTCATPWKGRR